MKGIATGDLLEIPEMSKIYSLVDKGIKMPIFRPLISFDSEQLTRYKNLFHVSSCFSCPNLCKDDVSPELKNQFFENKIFDEMVRRAIERVKQKAI